MEYSWNDQIGSRGRRPMLLLKSVSKVFRFSGESIPRVCVVTSKEYEKAGKWSNTTYQLQIADGFTPVPLQQSWGEGRFINRFDSLEAVAKELELTDVRLDVVAAFVRDKLPGAWKSFQEVQRQLDELAGGNESSWEEQVLENTSLSRRSGSLHIFVDGNEWRGEPIPGKLVVVKEESLDYLTRWTVKTAPGVVIETRTTREIHVTRWITEAKAVGLPPVLLIAFAGDQLKTAAFIEKVEAVTSAVNEHVLCNCGRERIRAEMIRVSGDEDFFLGADPNEVAGFMRDYYFPPEPPQSAALPSCEGSNTAALAEAFRKAGFG